MKKIFAGIDGGGTNTNCIIADEKLNILSESAGGPSNILVRDINEVAYNIYGLLRENLTGIGKNFEDLSGIVIGTAGAGRKNHAGKLENSLKKLFLFSKVKVVSDALISLEGAFEDEPGSILIAGTGSIIFGKDKNNNFCRAGGFGRIIGDEGSGYSIGRKGLNVVSREFDGRGKNSLLTNLISNKYGINDSESLIDKVYNSNLDVAEIAKYVIDAADKDDDICKSILFDEASELIKHVKAIMKRLKIEKMNLCLSGSLLTNDNFYSEVLLERLSEMKNLINVVEPKYSPALGAVLIAKRLFAEN
jgi:N-acetylglucosamine kinase-like BadF-type ATPase